MGRFLRYIPLLAIVVVAGCGSNDATPKTADASAKKSTGGRDGGTVRIDIKHGIDPDAASIDTTAKDISVEDILATKLPEDAKSDLASYGDKRLGEFEKSTYRVKGTLVSVIQRKDGDYFLVMKGKTDETVVIEVPDPKLCKGSPIEKEIQEARQNIEAKYHPTETLKEINEPATIEGVGFYGTGRGKGSGGNGAKPRLMPGTKFKTG